MIDLLESQTIYQTALKEGIAIGKREQAAAVAELCTSLRGAVDLLIADGRFPRTVDLLTRILAKHAQPEVAT